LTIKYKWEEEGLYRKFTDKINGDEILDDNLKLQGDVRFDDIRYVINDFTQIRDFDFSVLDVKKVAVNDEVASLSNPKIKIALISGYEPLLKWLKLYSESMEGSLYKCGIFDNSDDAYKWVSA